MYIYGGKAISLSHLPRKGVSRMEREKLKHKRSDKPFYNIRCRSEFYYAIGEYSWENHLNVARCIEEALQEYCDKRGIEVDA
jgi:hypothetical protein